jgi:hypothetical protein
MKEKTSIIEQVGKSFFIKKLFKNIYKYIKKVKYKFSL